MSSVNIVFDYDHVPTVREFSNNDKFARAIVGPFGSGKSSGCVMELLKNAKQQAPNEQGVRITRHAVVRNTYPQLRDTTIRTFHEWVPPKFFGQYKIVDHDYIVDFQDRPLPDGTKVRMEVLFRALDRPEHVSNLLSLDLTMAWFNEIREIPKALFDAMHGRVGRYPPMRDGGPTRAGIICDTNPCDEDHWFYKLFEEQILKDELLRSKYQIFHQPSGLSAEAENIKNLPKNYYENLMVGKDQNFINVYVHGKYGYVRDGKPVYNNYNDFIHVSEEAIEPIRGVPIILGFDFGLTPACSVCQLSSKGKFSVLKEFVSDNMGVRRFVKDVVKPYLFAHYNGFPLVVTGDPAGVRRSDTDERSCYDELRNAGLPGVPARSNATQLRFSAVDTYLTKLVEGKPAFQIDPSCTILRKGFNGEYKYRRIQRVGDFYTDEPEKNIYSHIHEALQYAAMLTEGEGYNRAVNRRARRRTARQAPPASAWT